MLKFEKGNIYYGFELQKIQNIKDINSCIYLFYHKKSGSRLIYMLNNDKNRVFFITFKTPPENHKGTAHIMEHSVLCGSKKYPVKDPFNELAKGSLNTYLNALTYADKTVYPIGSTNIYDFENLMNVYLDAVFNTLIYERKEIFLQEGWHYELNEDNTKLKYTGVVYNEMKGAFSDPERILSNVISKSLFKNSAYKYESGGDPEYITDLTYDEFLDFHKKYYHPSNSYIYLYGDMDIEKYLKKIDEEYLSKYNKIDIDNNIECDTFNEENNFSETYSAQSDDEGTYFAYNIVTGKSNDPIHMTAMNILSYILFETEGSTIKRKIIDSGIAEDVESWYDSSTYQTVLSIIGKNCDVTKKDEFKNIINSELERIVKDGIDKDILKSSINVFDFHAREENYGYKPKGLAYGLKILKSWLHGFDNFEIVESRSYIQKIRELSEEGYLESVIKECLINNNHKSMVVLLPEAGKQLKADKEIEQKLQNILNSMSKEDINNIIEENKSLREYQNKIETKEDLETIPVISIDQIAKEAEKINNKLIETKQSKVVFTPYNTNGILYTQIAFDTRSVPTHLISYGGLIASLMGRMGTKKYDFKRLPTEINMYTGDVSLSFDIFSRSDDDYTPTISLNGKVLEENTEKMFEIFEEIIFNTVFENKDDFRNIIKSEKLDMEDKILNSTHIISSIKSLSHFSENSAYNDKTSGMAYYEFLCDIEKRMEYEFDEIVKNIYETYKYIFNKENVIGALETEEKYVDKFINCFDKFTERLSDNTYEKLKPDFDYSINSEAIITNGKVVYDSKAFNYKKLGYEYSGYMSVLKNIINLEYLWNVVRIQGGAYGSSCQILRNGNIYLYSYRDPNVKETLYAFDNIGKFIENFDVDEREMKKYIIGTINSYDRPKSMSERADMSFAAYMCNISNEFRQKEREEILSANIENIVKYKELFNKIIENGSICVIGNELKIKENENIFEKITHM